MLGGTAVADSDICYGFLLGFLTAGVIGFVFQRLVMLRKKAVQADKKIAVVETKQSPRQVYMTSVRAQTEMIVWILLLIFLAIAVLWIALSS